MARIVFGRDRTVAELVCRIESKLCSSRDDALAYRDGGVAARSKIARICSTLLGVSNCDARPLIDSRASPLANPLGLSRLRRSAPAGSVVDLAPEVRTRAEL